MKKKFLISIILFLASWFSLAQTQNALNALQESVLEQLHLKPDEIREELYAEKNLPQEKNLSVVVVSRVKNESDIGFDIDEYVLVVDNSTNKIVSRFFKKNAWTSDAVVLSSIVIDTAPYVLDENNRAFGIRVKYRGSSHANPYENTDLSLFVRKGETLQPLLSDYTISEYRGEWDTNCKGEFESTESLLSMDEKRNRGFRSIRVKSTVAKFRNYVKDGDCKEKTTSVKTHVSTLIFDGKHYTKPKPKN